MNCLICRNNQLLSCSYCHHLRSSRRWWRSHPMTAAGNSTAMLSRGYWPSLCCEPLALSSACAAPTHGRQPASLEVAMIQSGHSSSFKQMFSFFDVFFTYSSELPNFSCIYLSPLYLSLSVDSAARMSSGSYSSLAVLNCSQLSLIHI